MNCAVSVVTLGVPFGVQLLGVANVPPEGLFHTNAGAVETAESNMQVARVVLRMPIQPPKRDDETLPNAKPIVRRHPGLQPPPAQINIGVI